MKKTLIVLMLVLLSAVLVVSCDDSSKKVYKVTFDSNGGSDVAAVEVKEGEKVTKPADPEKAGYELTKWTTDEEGEEVYDFESPVTSDITLYAQWKDKVYKVGDTGPAGGLIFYVNPDSNADWKYLEAGKADLSGTYKWGPQGADCETVKEIGAGKANTKKLYDKGSNYQAAYAVYGKDLYNNGYTDWFLPSNEELKLMYNNLHKHNPALGNFSTGSTPYLSSSEEGGSDTGNKYVYLLYFGSGSNQTGSRDGSWLVRPVRAFK